MADEKPESKLTEYVILRRIGDRRPSESAAYEVLGWKEGRGARSAVSAFLDANAQEEATFLAVPTSSFNLFESKREQPPPVFRLTEIPDPTPTPLGAEPAVAAGSPDGGEGLTKPESAPEDSLPGIAAITSFRDP